jgi:cell division protease FtsH
MTTAGRIAEEFYTEDISTGASNDIKQMTRMARKMVCEWGESERLGMVEYGEHEDYVFLGREMSRAREYNEATAQDIDREVRSIVDEAYARAFNTALHLQQPSGFSTILPFAIAHEHFISIRAGR